MRINLAVRLYAVAFGMLVTATTASAQFLPRPVPETVTGERYHVEAAAGFWSPAADMSIASEGLGIVGSKIDFKQDLGLNDARFRELHLLLRPATKHKFRFQYIPIKYSAQAVQISRDIVFNGQRYRVGLPVNWALDWKAYRFGYEYDFIYRDRGFGGVVVDFKYTDVQATLESPIVNEFAHARAPIPSIGGIGRFYIFPNLSITGELTMIAIPDSVSESFDAHYKDLDIYGTYNFTNNIGAQFGYRSFDLGYLVDDDTGSFVLKGVYFGVVARY
jgi:hypothetical protein